VSSRVNYVTIINGQVKRYVQGIDESLDYLFAVGPDIVLRWIGHLAADGYATDEWLTDTLCEGAVLIDVDRRHLLMFSMVHAFVDDACYEYRAATLDAYGRTWDGWSIEWAVDGIGDIVTYLGEDRRTVRGPAPDDSEIYPYGRDESEYPPKFLVSVADADECRTYGLKVNATRPWLLGPALLDSLTIDDAITSLAAIPLAGLHLDPATHRAGLWSTMPLEGVTEWWPTRWPGWTLELWGDDFDRQISRCGALTLPAVDLKASLEELADRVDSYWPVEERMRADEVDVDQLRKINFAGIRSQLAADVTPEEIDAAVAVIRGATGTTT
jgi:hypothetical protein